MKKYSIFQVKDDAANSRYVKFSSLDMVQSMGITLSLDMYENVYDGEIEEREDAEATLNAIYMFLNIGKRPEDYRGHSLSMSDIILIDGHYYYVDDYGFTEIKFNVECPTCGSLIPAGSEFCEECGDVFEREDVV